MEKQYTYKRKIHLSDEHRDKIKTYAKQAEKDLSLERVPQIEAIRAGLDNLTYKQFIKHIKEYEKSRLHEAIRSIPNQD